MRYCFLLLTAFILLTNATCQNTFSINDVVPGGSNFKKYQPQLSKFKFSSNGKGLYLIDNNSVRVYDVNTGVAVKVLFDINSINAALATASVSQVRVLPDFSWGQDKVIYFQVHNELIFFDYSTKAIVSKVLIDGNSDIDYIQKRNIFAYTISNRLIVRDLEQQLYILGDTLNRELSYGAIVSQGEFGIEKGTFWSPSGKYLLFYRMNESFVNKYPLVDYSVNPPKVTYINYPMAGTKNQEVSVGMLELSSGKITYINNGNIADRYYTNITWSPDESSFYISEIDRSQQNMDMVRYDVDDLNTPTIMFSENESKYIEPENGLFFIPKNNKEFLWLSRRSGYNHFYRYNSNGDVLRQLTKGNWEVTKPLGYTDDGKSFLFEGNKDGALERQIYKIDITKGTVVSLSKVSGFHEGTLSSSGGLLLDQYSSPTVPGTIELINFASNSNRVISSAYSPLKKEKLPKIEIVKIKSADDSTDLYCRIITPPDFDSKKKYPVIVYVYGGPHSQLVNNKWLNGAPLWDVFMAQKGYIVFTLDNRGTSFRGKEFEQSVYLSLGQNEMADQIKGIEYLKTLPFVDRKWIGVFGWSFGGYMAISLLENYPDVFKVGVAGGPVIDWGMYEIMYTERYMSSPQNNAEGYDKCNLLKGVANISGKLLVIHGGNDPAVLCKQSINFVSACINEDVQLDYFVYPNAKHNVLGHDRVHLMEKITEYFDDFLR